jgi:glycosyltransferase involved in cell wall biosynthesis
LSVSKSSRKPVKKVLPTLSIIVPTHRRPRELRRCLAAIQRAVTLDYELILVSDVHCADTRQVAGEFLRDADQYLERGKNPGPAHSRNVGLKHSVGQFVLFFDDDDELPPTDYDQFLHKALLSPKNVTFGDIIIVQEDRERGVLTGEAPVRINVAGNSIEQLYVKNFIPLPAAIFPRLVIESCSFDPYMQSLEDWDFMLQALSNADFVGESLISAIVYKDYVNAGNRRGSSVDATGDRTILEYLYVYRRWNSPSMKITEQRSRLLGAAGLAPLAALY